MKKYLMNLTTNLLLFIYRICDWGSIQANLITIRTHELRKLLNNVISFGFEQKDEDYEIKKLTVSDFDYYNTNHSIILPLICFDI